LNVLIYPIIKRALDILFSFIGLLLLAPLFLTIAAALRLTSPGPVYYRGRRVGQGGRSFEMLKFRTMRVDADRIGGTSTAADDPRITSIGKWLRRYKLDELPQLINVIKGDMSLVGPRPQVQWDVDNYTEQERALLSVRPGITDYASLRFRNESEILRGHEDADAAYVRLIRPEKVRLGLEYVRTRSFRVDLVILIRTLLALVGGDSFGQAPLPPPPSVHSKRNNSTT
jgi:lipopolysaccharide/colanic/teichoic acid biosynthesis glycosyltransferase